MTYGLISLTKIGGQNNMTQWSITVEEDQFPREYKEYQR